MPTAQQLLDSLNSSIQNMDEVAQRMKILLYGQSGVGKTVEAMELAQRCTPDDKRILYIDTGEGWVSLLNHPQLMKRTTRLVYKGISQIEVLVDAISASVPNWDDYGSIVFDEFSTSAKQYLHVVIDATGLNRLTDAPEFKQWGILSRNIDRTVWQLLRLKESHHLIFVAHERVNKDKLIRTDRTRPSFMESIEGTVKENVHVVARMTAEVTNKTGIPLYKRTLQVHPTTMVVAKTRVGGLEIIVTPDQFNKRIEEWLAAGGRLVDETQVVELDSEKKLSEELRNQDPEFAGYEESEVEE
jgi:adenylate kinase family enzyme